MSKNIFFVPVFSRFHNKYLQWAIFNCAWRTGGSMSTSIKEADCVSVEVHGASESWIDNWTSQRQVDSNRAAVWLYDNIRVIVTNGVVSIVRPDLENLWYRYQSDAEAGHMIKYCSFESHFEQLDCKLPSGVAASCFRKVLGATCLQTFFGALIKLPWAGGVIGVLSFANFMHWNSHFAIYRQSSTGICSQAAPVADWPHQTACKLRDLLHVFPLDAAFCKDGTGYSCYQRWLSGSVLESWAPRAVEAGLGVVHHLLGCNLANGSRSILDFIVLPKQWTIGVGWRRMFLDVFGQFNN